jgi:hypothetical protein
VCAGECRGLKVRAAGLALPIAQAENGVEMLPGMWRNDERIDVDVLATVFSVAGDRLRAYQSRLGSQPELCKSENIKNN